MTKKILFGLLSIFGLFSFSFADTINVFYNGFNDVETFTCDGDTAIYLEGNYNYTDSNSLFTPYITIDYRDEDNQKLSESYDKSILYLSGGNYKKTYTGDNERILTEVIDSSNSELTSYVPVFEVSGSTQPIDTEYNMFNNFSDNALQLLLSNIPGYIQYVLIIGIILFIIGIIKMLKRRK